MTCQLLVNMPCISLNEEDIYRILNKIICSARCLTNFQESVIGSLYSTLRGYWPQMADERLDDPPQGATKSH